MEVAQTVLAKTLIVIIIIIIMCFPSSSFFFFLLLARAKPHASPCNMLNMHEYAEDTQRTGLRTAQLGRKQQAQQTLACVMSHQVQLFI